MKKLFPTKDMELTHILVINNLEKSKEFYVNILGAKIHSEYGGTSYVLKFQGTWLLLVTGSGPTKDNPEISFIPPDNSNRINHSFTIRVKDCNESYKILKSRGAECLTPPVDWGQEIRCFFTDPNGHLFEISQLA